MQAELNRAVILDLLPGYFAGDASPETKALVEKYAAQDADVAKILAAGVAGLDELHDQRPSEDVAAQTLSRTRRRIRWQAWQTAVAIVLSVGAASLGWLGTFLAVLFWIIYFRSGDRLHELLFGPR